MSDRYFGLVPALHAARGALDAPDGVMLDVTGALHLFGGERCILVEIETRLQAQGFAARAALAGTPEAAWALARYGNLRLLPDGLDERHLTRALGSLPLAALRLEEDLVAGLARAGLRRVGDIILRPRAPLAARFRRLPFRAARCAARALEKCHLAFIRSAALSD